MSVFEISVTLSVSFHEAIIMLLSRIPSPQAKVGGLPPPPGTTVDSDHPDTNLYKYNIACQVLCYCIVGPSVLARIYTKIFIKRKVGSEDCKFLPTSTLLPPDKLMSGRLLHTGMGRSPSLFKCREFHLTVFSYSRLHKSP